MNYEHISRMADRR